MFIYSLSDPTTKEIRYIGFTSRSLLDKRLSEHLRDNRKTRKNSWIKSLKNKGLKPEINILEYCNLENWKNLEKKWILQMKSDRLTNHTLGGEGILGYKFSDEQRKANSERNKGKILSKKHRENISKANKGRKINEDTKNKIRTSHIGMTLSEETKLKIGLHHKGKIVSDETRDKIRKTMKSKGISPPKSNGGKQKRAVIAYLPNWYNNGELVFYAEYESVTKASHENFVSTGAIFNNLKGLTKHCRGFIWKYKEN